MILNNINFEKYHGLGNDYIIINDIKYAIPEHSKPKLAKRLCEQHFSIGADGLIFVMNSDEADIRMRIFNNDGSEAEMCGNGIRCFSKFIYENEIVKKTEIAIETLNGFQKAKLSIEGDKVRAVEINMGSPTLQCHRIPVDLDVDNCINEKIVSLDKIFSFTAVSMGNPHAVIFIEEILNDNDLNKYGSNIESKKIFPNKINVEFVKVISSTECKMRVFERGVGITNSCGTGSCATVVAGCILGIFDRDTPVIVRNDGGDLSITYSDQGDVLMEGPIENVFHGTIDKLEII
ncbi:MAG: Diaminopimelate epimerase [Promethearchaeota archaeon]|nr:MAG: Diaminopimelate epimerase [Candidatus Lokiarchaeota archaeon]